MTTIKATVSREFTRKCDAEPIGKTVIEFEGTIFLNGKELSQASVEHLLWFSHQSILNSYTTLGNDTPFEEAKVAFDGKVESIVSGNLRANRAGVSDRQKLARSIARPHYLKACNDEAVKAYKEAATDEKNELLDIFIDNNEEIINELVDKTIEERKARNAALAKAKFKI